MAKEIVKNWLCLDFQSENIPRIKNKIIFLIIIVNTLLFYHYVTKKTMVKWYCLNNYGHPVIAKKKLIFWKTAKNRVLRPYFGLTSKVNIIFIFATVMSKLPFIVKVPVPCNRGPESFLSSIFKSKFQLDNIFLCWSLTECFNFFFPDLKFSKHDF